MFTFSRAESGAVGIGGEEGREILKNPPVKRTESCSAGDGLHG
jgi:hypothetical protein